MNATTRSPDIEELVRSAPLLSASASSLLQVSSRPGHELLDVIEVVKTDATLTAKVLKVVNSAAFGLVTTITTIDRAVSYLGERNVVGVAMSDCATSLYHKELAGYAAAAGDLWRHNLRAAVAAREVVAQSGIAVSPDLAFTAGLLHDLGKALISDALTGSTSEMLRQVEDGTSRDYLSAEEELIGFDHARVGFELARAWGLPEVLCQAIRHHHQPGAADEEYRPLVYAVHLGDQIAMLGGPGTGADNLKYPLASDYASHVKLDEDALMAVTMRVDDEFSKLAQSLSGIGPEAS
jgi:putative nucleotidyltransferase with HDIG domain